MQKTHTQVTNIGPTGFWLLVENRGYFVPFKNYPIFKNATIEQIFAIKQIAPGQYHWPLIDADMELEALEKPGQFPLIYQ